jgi:lipid-binding SYLF domain-containing protein
MDRIGFISWAVLAALVAGGAARADDPAETMRQSQQVLGELVAIPGKQIPHTLLAEAQGVAIIPRVVKVGFVAGLRRGNGVVMVRDAEGEWTLPQFIRLTGGSVGWQAGISGTDVVLVFATRKSVEGLMKGKFTIGADASAAAGPVGRNAAAATDAKLGAEIYSYSRSRGLFLGVSIDGSALEIDQTAHTAFYGTPTPQPPARVPDAAVTLRQYLVELTGQGAGPQAAEAAAAPGAGAAAPAVAPAVAAVTPTRLEALRQGLDLNARQMYAILAPEWQQYLALPAEAFNPAVAPNPATLAAIEQRYALVAGNAQYAQLTSRPEFQATHEWLREYAAAAKALAPRLTLPAPPAGE